MDIRRKLKSIFMKKVVKGTKEYLLRRLLLVFLIDFLFLMIFLSKPRFWGTIIIPELILYSSIGLLTFIAIFYTLIFSEASKTQLVDLKDKINLYLEEIEKNFETKKNEISDRDELILFCEATNSKISRIKFLKLLVQIDKILYICVVLFIISIYYMVIQNNVRVSSILFTIALVFVVHIITAWLFVFQDKYDLEESKI